MAVAAILGIGGGGAGGLDSFPINIVISITVTFHITVIIKLTGLENYKTHLLIKTFSSLLSPEGLFL